MERTNMGTLIGDSTTPGQPLRPMCFMAMPFGRRSADGMTIDFDRTWEYIRPGIQESGLEAIRADFEPSGGFIHRAMLERLLVAEYVVADLTMANPNVMYEVGVRHGASARATLLLCATSFVSTIPFDFKPLRMVSYQLAADGSLADESGAALTRIVCERLQQARSGQLPVDNPIMQVTAWKPSGSIEHSKTDVFLQRLQFTGELGQRIKAALAIRDRQQAIGTLAEIEQQVVNLPADVSQVHTALLGVYLGYREKKAYDRMASLFERMPGELRQTAVAREQYALALNRLAEAAVSEDRLEEADALRARAIATLDEIPSDSVTSETYGIRGRIYKAWHDALSRQGGGHTLRAESMLQRAIDTYEQGFRSDLRDYYPGVNTVTLRLLRGSDEDRAVLASLTRVVRYSVAAAPPPKNDEERYWQTATKLELATADRDWKAARAHLLELLGIDVEPWMRETTGKNLGRQQKAFADDAEAVEEIARIAGELRG
jgi:tetratricopeptide (TPR) repeat protein